MRRARLSNILQEVGLQTYTKDAKDNVEYDLEEMPITIIGDLEQDKFSCAEGVHSLLTKIHLGRLI